VEHKEVKELEGAVLGLFCEGNIKFNSMHMQLNIYMGIKYGFTQ